MNQLLIRLATEDKIRQCLIMMHPNKNPGPDGMTTLFFKHFWYIIKKEIY